MGYKGNIENYFYNIDYDFLVKLLSEKISDGRFINIIYKFLMAGYMKGEKLVIHGQRCHIGSFSQHTD